MTHSGTISVADGATATINGILTTSFSGSGAIEVTGTLDVNGAGSDSTITTGAFKSLATTGIIDFGGNGAVTMCDAKMSNRGPCICFFKQRGYDHVPFISSEKIL